MPSSGMWRHVGFVKTDILKEQDAHGTTFWKTAFFLYHLVNIHHIE
jgi:hypothetical protein